MNTQDQIKDIIGTLVLENAQLRTQLEEAHLMIQELQEEKDGSDEG